MTFDQVRDELAKGLELAQAGTKAIDPVARAFSLGSASGLEEALALIDKALQEEQAARIKAAATGKGQK